MLSFWGSVLEMGQGQGRNSEMPWLMSATSATHLSFWSLHPYFLLLALVAPELNFHLINWHHHYYPQSCTSLKWLLGPERSISCEGHWQFQAQRRQMWKQEPRDSSTVKPTWMCLIKGTNSSQSAPGRTGLKPGILLTGPWRGTLFEPTGQLQAWKQEGASQLTGSRPFSSFEHQSRVLLRSMRSLMGKYLHRSNALKRVLTVAATATMVSDSVRTPARLK